VGTPASRQGRPRFPIFRALGAHEPPQVVEIQGGAHTRASIFKHDSWAATALYVGPAGKVVCKFNRQQSIFGIPMTGLGRMLAEREIGMLRCLEDVANVPRWLGPVCAEGRRLEHVVARAYVEGHPLGRRESLSPAFFDKLAAVLRVMHERGLAYVDLHKRENILVGVDREPYLFDFQISVALGHGAGPRHPWLDESLKLLQESDRYHLEKHRRHYLDGVRLRTLPWFIQAHRRIGRPFRELRRRLLVALGIRTGSGRAESEHFAEDAVRLELEEMRRAA
jgi:hypothetical protein